MRLKLIVAGVIILLVGIWAVVSFTGSLTSYVSITEAKTCGAYVQVMGEIQHQQVVYDTDRQLLSFPIKDKQGQTMQVDYTGTVPGNFAQATHVVCLGRYQGDAFAADQLLVKCPSKYAGEEN
ncbi:MAG: cytochrome c maturation protein CcmE [candidate division Zixibacteria bacterium]|nr:cytochrome c maturation protein CcmE [candidate division Zixibacteria bacterium]